jgi:hypothetical protein
MRVLDVWCAQADDDGAASLVSRVATHFFTDSFQGVVDEFIRRNCAIFIDVTDAQIEGEDNKLECVCRGDGCLPMSLSAVAVCCRCRCRCRCRCCSLPLSAFIFCKW